jgi:putative aminopeptidase FrvX
MTTLTIDTRAVTEFLVELLAVPSPTGYHREVMEVCRRQFAQIDGLELWTTRKGALMGRIRGPNPDLPPVGMTAHTDTLGLMVREIKADGQLTVQRIGGLLWNGAESENVTIRTHDDQRYRGTFALVNTSTHVNPLASTTERSEKTMEVRIDAKTRSRAETQALGIGVGDFVFVDPRVEVTTTGYIKSRFIDDKAGVACMWGALKALAEAGLQPAQDVIVQVSNYEEVGHGGAAGWPDDLEELLTVDMGAIGEGQNGDEYSVSICAKDASGPYHFDMIQKLRGLCDAHGIPHKVDLYIQYSSDGSAYWRAGGEARVGLCGPGVAASHSYERTHVDALTHTTHLLARYMLGG